MSVYTILQAAGYGGIEQENEVLKDNIKKTVNVVNKHWTDIDDILNDIKTVMSFSNIESDIQKNISKSWDNLSQIKNTYINEIKELISGNNSDDKWKIDFIDPFSTSVYSKIEKENQELKKSTEQAIGLVDKYCTDINNYTNNIKNFLTSHETDSNLRKDIWQTEEHIFVLLNQILETKKKCKNEVEEIFSKNHINIPKSEISDEFLKVMERFQIEKKNSQFPNTNIIHAIAWIKLMFRNSSKITVYDSDKNQELYNNEDFWNTLYEFLLNQKNTLILASKNTDFINKIKKEDFPAKIIILENINQEELAIGEIKNITSFIHDGQWYRITSSSWKKSEAYANFYSPRIVSQLDTHIKNSF